jgi:peptidoglycan/LPS O-acetylase OafA/YrhL
LSEKRSPLSAVFGRSFAEAERAENNLAVLRFAAASAVLFAHSWPIALGDGRSDPVSRALTGWFGHSAALSAMAIHAFFVISGYLVTKSALSRDGVNGYAWARLLRIYPALIVNVLLCALVLGVAVTTLAPGQYFASPQLWKFVGNNVLSWNVIYPLPGVFDANPLHAVNGSLWTLPLEIRCYVAIGLFLALGVLTRGWLFSLLAAGLVIGDSVFRQLELLGADSAATCICFFLIGALFSINRARIAAPPLIGLALLIAATFIPLESVARLCVLVGFAWIVLWLGVAAPRAPWPEKLIGDPSYGIYIYAFPIQQLTVLLLGAGSPWLVVAVAGPATLIAGIISWKLIEQPMLKRKGAAAAGFAKLFKRGVQTPKTQRAET